MIIYTIIKSCSKPCRNPNTYPKYTIDNSLPNILFLHIIKPPSIHK